MTPPRPGERRADDERDRERQLDVDPERGDHRAVVDACADDHARARALQPQPEQEADPDRDAENDEPRRRVDDARDVQVGERVEVARPGDVLRDAAEVREHLVGEDDRDRDRDQRLAQVLALRPAEEELLHHEARGRDDRDADERRNDPVREVDLRALEAERAALADHAPLDRERDVAAEQEERAVRHVDDAHEAEDEREAARDDEVEAGGGDAVQHRDQEVLRVVHGRAERRRVPAGRRREEAAPRARAARRARRASPSPRCGARAPARS